MKRVKCPKCDTFIVFDETKYKQGQALVFKCKECKKEFGIRIGLSKLNATIVENKFAFKQVIPLQLGDNVFGRYLKGTDINKPIITSDPSVDTLHCIINVKIGKNGKPVYTLRDAPSNTGTFVMNAILANNERRVIEDGTIINIGATTMILHTMTEDA